MKTMKRLLNKLKNDCRGAVTVMVTLLLIPAVLISGTGVDLARAYAAKSIVQDANQLAANSMLASYDALLQDLYGLFGMMTKDEAFADMVEEYVNTALGENWKNSGMGTFQLLYGSNIQTDEVTAEKDMNLANTAVLRRQIEEYAKYRAPVIIVEEVIAALDAFEKIQADSKIVKQKLDIDEQVEEIDEIYKKIYDKINEVNKAGKREDSAYESVNAFIVDGRGTTTTLYETIQNMYAAREAYHEESDENYKADRERAYNGYCSNVKALINGGNVVNYWIMGNYDDEGNYHKGGWNDSHNATGLKSSIGSSKKDLKGYIEKLEDLVKLCQKADEEKAKLKAKLDTLESDLGNGKCSQQLRDGMTSKNKETGKSMLDTYRDLLQYDLKSMAEAMQQHDKPQIQDNIDHLENDIVYGDPDLGIGYFYSLDNLPNAMKDSLIEFGLEQQLHYDEQAGDALAVMSTVDPQRYSTLGKFLEFQDFTETHNNDFYNMLCKLYSGTTGDSKDAYKDSVKTMVSKIQQKLKDIFCYEPEGAYTFSNKAASAAPKTEEETDSYLDKDWGEDTGVINDAMNDKILTRLGKSMESAANKVLLLTYDSEMFSCYATGKSGSSTGEDGKKEPEVTMNGVTLGVEVNYYYQSELEYLFHGDRSDARNNLKATAGLMFLVRFVFNYVASFSIPSVQSAVTTVESALAWAGPFAVVAGELVRLGLALGESAMDIGRLKGGSKVALYKVGDHIQDTDQGWRFSITGALTEGAKGLEKVSLNIEEDSDDDSTGMSYKDYMRLFLLLIDGDVLAQRTANLIEMNMTNVKEGIASKGDREQREAAMSTADMFLMREAATGISLTTTLELRMLFLSMPFAQKGVNGVVPPGTVEIRVTDYRGY